MDQPLLEKTRPRLALLILALAFFGSALVIHHRSPRPLISVSKQDSAYNLNQTFLRLISLGNKRVISNVLWIMTLLESDHEKYKQHNYADWMYLRFMTIAGLDPWFYENYLYGGMYLSVIKDDLEGAAELFELGLKKYPDDYYINYYASFNYFFEMGDYERGFPLLEKIKDHPKAPQGLKFVVSKLRFENEGNYDIAIQFLKESYDLTKDERIRKKIANDIYAIVAQRDLECLNAGKSGCRRVDLNGDPYIVSGEGKWTTKFPFLPYKIFRPAFKKDSGR